MPELSFCHLSVDYAGVRTVDDVSFSVSSGEIVGLVGESGCGKSTILRSAIGLIGDTARIAGGSIELDGEDLVHAPEATMRALRGNRISMVFQDHNMSFSPVRTIRKHLEDAQRAHGKLDKAKTEREAIELFERLNLPGGKRILDSYSFELSGGMNQRVAIAFAMLSYPDFLLADEPTSALDVTSQQQVIDELLQMRAETNCGMLVVTHNIGVVRLLADKVGVVYAGQLVEFGRTAEVLADPLHPYTRALLASVPVIGGPIPAGIAGAPPDYAQFGEACRFAPRCTCAGQSCREGAPTRTGCDEHWALCRERAS